jgi:hypothetical protein
MVHLKHDISIKDAKKLLESIKNEKLQEALKNGHFAPDGYLTDASVYWLYCWAQNGDEHDGTRDAARNAWDAIFDIPYNAFKEDVFYDIARRLRYK